MGVLEEFCALSLLFIRLTVPPNNYIFIQHLIYTYITFSLSEGFRVSENTYQIHVDAFNHIQHPKEMRVGHVQVHWSPFPQLPEVFPVLWHAVTQNWLSHLSLSTTIKKEKIGQCTSGSVIATIPLIEARQLFWFLWLSLLARLIVRLYWFFQFRPTSSPYRSP